MIKTKVKNKLHAYEIGLEITRNCNLNCSHCLRGNTQNKTMSKEVIHEVFNKVDTITNIFFSGGEPLLAIDVIEEIIKEIKRRDIEINGFGMVTNGTVFNDKIHDVLFELYELSIDKNSCIVEISNDVFHNDSIYNFPNCEDMLRNKRKLETLVFVNKRQYIDYSNYHLLKEGRCKEGHVITKPQITLDKFKDGTIEVFNDFYVNIYGDLISSCSIAYDRQKEFKFASIFDDKEKIMSELTELYLTQGL